MNMPQCHCMEHPKSNLWLHYDQTHKWYEEWTVATHFLKASYGLGILDYLGWDKRSAVFYELHHTLSVGRYQDSPAADGAGGVFRQPAIDAVHMVLMRTG